MTLEEFKSHLAEIYREGNIGVCLQEIKRVLISNWSTTYKEVNHLNARYNTLRKEKNIVGLEFQEFAIHESGLGIALLDLIAQFQEKDFDLNFSLQNEIHQTLTIVVNGPQSLQPTLQYFNTAIYKSIEPLDIADLNPDVQSRPARLIVLANLTDYRSDLYEKELRNYLDDSSKPEVLYFGGRWPRLDNYPDQVYAANSKFSLQARIREMLEYLKSKP